MTGKRKRYGAEFKARVALEALRGELTTAQLAAKHGVHQTMVGEWKRQAMDGLASVFSGKEAAQDTARLSEAEVEKLHDHPPLRWTRVTAYAAAASCSLLIGVM